MKTRKEMIKEMSDVMYENIIGDGQFCGSLIEDGFKGYKNYSDDELLNEYNNYMGVSDEA